MFAGIWAPDKRRLWLPSSAFLKSLYVSQLFVALYSSLQDESDRFSMNMALESNSLTRVRWNL